jgi:hypothetical protein
LEFVFDFGGDVAGDEPGLINIYRRMLA